jgi:hypothetical protein
VERARLAYDAARRQLIKDRDAALKHARKTDGRQQPELSAATQASNASLDGAPLGRVETNGRTDGQDGCNRTTRRAGRRAGRQGQWEGAGGLADGWTSRQTDRPS